MTCIFKRDLYRHALNYFCEVPGGIVRRKQCELRSTRWSNLNDMPFPNSARIYVDADLRGISYLHVRQLSLAEVGLNPSCIRNKGKNLRARRK